MKTFLGKSINKIFNRLTITVLLILIQLGWFALLLLKLADYASWISMLFMVVAVVMALYIVRRDDNPAYKMGWIIIVSIVPILGVTMYIFFGNKRPSKSLKKKLDRQERIHRDDLRQEDDLTGKVPKRMYNTLNYVCREGPFPAWSDTESRYYSLGENAYRDLLDDLKNAEKFIFMEYFIISEGKMWDEIFDVLKSKAEEGVDVRIIYDDVGSINTLPKNFASALGKSGIKFIAFNPLTVVVSLIYNYRDHRKITVIDGHIGYSGGYNIADEYINKLNRFGHWKDTGIRLEGRAVWNFTVAFLNMWNAINKTDEDYAPFRPQENDYGTLPENKTKGIVQPFSDSPLDGENVGENVYFEILAQAEDYVYIFTPYLVIDNEMKVALTLAAKRGVDVRIVTPGIPDKKMIFRLTRSYYEPLIRAGVRIYEYTPGFMHAKSYISDDKIGVVGSINMDYRSLYLHFECGALMIGCDALKDLKKDCIDTFERSREVQKKDLHVGFFGTLFDSILRVLSPLL